jgi:hypothetical protein
MGIEIVNVNVNVTEIGIGIAIGTEIETETKTGSETGTGTGNETEIEIEIEAATEETVIEETDRDDRRGSYHRSHGLLLSSEVLRPKTLCYYQHVYTRFSCLEVWRMYNNISINSNVAT